MIYLKNKLTDTKLHVRIFSLWGIGILLNLIAWFLGYYLLPEGILKDIFPGGSFIPSDSDFASTIFPIILYNIVLASGFIIAANLFRVKWFPLGYFPVLFHWFLFGLFLGSNSFGVSKGEKLAPSLFHLFQSTGFMEITAYTLIAAASINVYMYRQEALWSLKTEKVRSRFRIKLVLWEYITIFIAILLILFAAFKETVSILFK